MTAARAVRWGVPLAMVVAGVVTALSGWRYGVALGAVLVGGAAVVAMLSFFLRMGLAETADRDREEAAREHFDRTGRWPEDEGG